MDPNNRDELITFLEEKVNDFGYRHVFVHFAEEMINQTIKYKSLSFREGLEIHREIDSIWFLGKFEDRREKNAIRGDK